MDYRILWLRIAYWTGAIIDGLVVIPLLDSDIWAAWVHIPGFHASWEFRFAQACVAAFMSAWTVLLIWADRRPIERRGVLPITVCPVIIGLNLANYYLYRGGFIPAAWPIESLGLPIALTALFLFSYFNSFRKPAREIAA